MSMFVFLGIAKKFLDSLVPPKYKTKSPESSIYMSFISISPKEIIVPSML